MVDHIVEAYSSIGLWMLRVMRSIGKGFWMLVNVFVVNEFTIEVTDITFHNTSID